MKNTDRHIVNITEAKANLSKLVAEVEAGAEVLIGRAGQPSVLMIKFEATKQPRKAGALKGKIWIADDFDVLPDDLAEAFGIDSNPKSKIK